MTDLAAVNITADDFLDAARTIPLGEVSTCDWLTEWLSAATFLEWAKRGLRERDPYGLSNAICYAKRSACCRLDLLLRYNHLTPFMRANYPDKINALERVGIDVRRVVHELVIDPRNELEHHYRAADEAVASHAVDIADLFLRATDAERQRSSIVAVNWNVVTRGLVRGKERVDLREFSERPMLFMDVFEEPPKAKVVDPGDGHVRFAELQSFSRDQAVTLAKLLRSSYSQGSLSVHGAGSSYYLEAKRQMGF